MPTNESEKTTRDPQSSPICDPHPMDTKPIDRARVWRDIELAIGHRYANARLNKLERYDPKQEKAFEALRYFAESMPDQIGTGGGLILYGTPGTGKDHALSALLSAAVNAHGYTAMFRDGMALFAEVRRAIGNNSEDDLRRDLCTPQILAISDPIPPVGELTDYQSAFIRDIIDRRYRRCLSTWITSNLGKAGLETSLTLPVFERLRENATVVFFDWESYRTRQA